MRGFLLKVAVLASIFFVIGRDSTLAKSITIDFINSNPDSLRIIYLVDKADSLKDIDYRSARKFANESLVLARKFQSKSLLYKTLSITALLDWYNGDHGQCLEKCYEALILAKDANNDYGIAKRYHQMGLVYLYTSDYDSAIFYNEKALESYTNIADTTGILKIHGYLGLIYDHQANYIKAKENLLSAVLTKRRFETLDWSILQLTSGEYDKSYYTESLVSAKDDLINYPEDSPPTDLKRFAFYNLGVAYLNLGHPDSALIYYWKSAAVARQLNKDIYWNEFSKAYTLIGEYDSAIWAHNKAMANANDHGTRINQAVAYSILGNSYMAMKKYDMAIDALKKELHLDKAMGHKYATMRTMNLIAECAIGNGNGQEALEYISESIVLARKIGAKKGLVDGLNIAYQAFDMLGQYKKALDIKKTHDGLWDVLHEQKTELDLAKLDLFYEVELKKMEITELNRLQQLSKVNLQNRTLIMIIVVIISFFIVLLLILYYLRTRKLLNLNKILNTQQDVIRDQFNKLTISNKEKEVLLGEIHHRVKNNLQVISSLLSMQRLQLTDKSARQAVMEGQNRVQTMGLIHESLYQNDDFDSIDMHVYLKKLADNLINSFGYYPDEVGLKIDIVDVNLIVDFAINIGLVTNELVTNALKHAFAGFPEAKELLIKMHYLTDNSLALIVENNGFINKEKINPEKANSFGLKLIGQIIKKYDGLINFELTDKTRVSITLFIK